MLSLTESDNGRNVGIRIGESIRIALPENATTGYRWAIDRCDEEFVQPDAEEVRYPENAIGSGGEIAFRFRGMKAGFGEVMLKYWRHWEGDASVIARFRVRIEVRA
jgi:inhibitor of cysteine peptidase